MARWTDLGLTLPVGAEATRYLARVFIHKGF